MNNKTVYDVIDIGVNHLLSVYDNWNVEHVLDILTIFDSALSIGSQNTVDIAKYTKLFGYGSSPANWEGQDVPSIETIKENLKTLPERARKLTDEQLSQELNEPVAGCQTLNELLVLNAFHVPLHAGKIEEMTRVLKHDE